MPSIICLKNKNGIACASDLPILLKKDKYFFVSLKPCSYTTLEDLSSFVQENSDSSILVCFDSERQVLQSSCSSIQINEKGRQAIEVENKDSLDALRKKAISLIPSSKVNWVLFDRFGKTGSNL